MEPEVSQHTLRSISVFLISLEIIGGAETLFTSSCVSECYFSPTHLGRLPSPLATRVYIFLDSNDACLNGIDRNGLYCLHMSLRRRAVVSRACTFLFLQLQVRKFLSEIIRRTLTPVPTCNSLPLRVCIRVCVCVSAHCLCSICVSCSAPCSVSGLTVSGAPACLIECRMDKHGDQLT